MSAPGGPSCAGARGTGAECRKFAPNIFNKSKCSSCFKQKEEHSAEALESNRATRKISKCGYLFVAPGWDFSNPLNRTKRWQRRWFVLYDDGELTYSVDEHPETVPQARIDMTRVLEVAAAEDVTGHPYSLAITSPEGVTFVKGTCREETRWWADVLQVYSRNKGRHKRNATFPGGQTTILQITPSIRSNTPNPSRPRFNSCRSEPRNSGSPWISETRVDLCSTAFSSLGGSACATNSNASITSSTNSSSSSFSSSSVGSNSSSNNGNNNNSSSNGNNNNNNENNASIGNASNYGSTTFVTCNQEAKSSLKSSNSSPLRSIGHTENGVHAHTYVGSTGGTSSITINGATPAIGSTATVTSTTATLTTTTTTAATTRTIMTMTTMTAAVSATTITPATSSILSTEKPPIGKGTTTSCNDGSRSYRDQPVSSISPPTRDKLRAEDKARRRMISQQKQQQQEERTSSASVDKLDDDACRRILLEHEREREGKLRDIATSLTQPRIRRNKSRISEPTRDVVDAANMAHQDKLIRGDPDGCGLDISGTRYSPTSELRVDLPAEDILNIKKGWLMKQSLNKEWNKHWFVLRGCGLMYYRDPSAEDKGIMDGVIDLNTVTVVTPVQVARNYGFQTMTWDGRGSTVLSAVTAGIRSSWMSAIRRAANLPDTDNALESHTVCQDSQQPASTQSPTASIGERDRDSALPSTPLTPRSVLFSSDEEYRTASEGGRRESGDWSEMPASPPLTRNGEWSPLSSQPHQQQQQQKQQPQTQPQSQAQPAVQAKHEWAELPPSPPLARTALSRVKARSRSSSRSRVYKRSRSSPPGSRRSTLDSVRSEDLELARDGLEEPPVTAPPAPPAPPLLAEVLGGQLALLRERADGGREAELEGLRARLRASEEELERLRRLADRDKEQLECRLLESDLALRESDERCELLRSELSSSHASVERLRAELATLSDRLSQGIEENERLYSRVRELEIKAGLSSSRERGRSFDSLSDLTNIDLDLDLNALDKERVMEEYDELRSRFEKAILEIRAMRKELREAHAIQDDLELEVFAHKQEATRTNESNQAQVQLMAARIQDLTNKLAGSEKQVRSLKQKLSKIETRDKRRSLSLKGRESLQISQEVEDKLLDLEKKICAIEQGKRIGIPVATENACYDSSSNLKKERKRENRSLDRTGLRRKSLDSATSSEPMKVLIRLSTLETKVASAAENMISDAEKDSSECSEVSTSSTCHISVEILSRLRKLERAVAKSKRRLEKCLGSTQAEEKAEKCLRAVNEILDSCVECKKNQSNSQITESVGVVVSKLETILRDKMYELMKRRQQLAETGQLNDKEKIKLVAERIAFEFVILRQIKCAMERTMDRSIVLSELVETSQLISNLKFKLNGTKPKTYQNTSYIQYLTRVLANKLVLIAGVPKTLENSIEVSAAQVECLNFLLQKQKEINEIVSSYKNEKLRLLAEALAAETFSLSEPEEFNKQVVVSSNKLVEDKRIREAWALAQETVSKELVQVEVSDFIMRCSQIYEQNISSVTDVCLNFDTSQNIDLESWADKAQSILRQDMECTIIELTDAYEACLLQLKKNKSTVNMQYDSRQLLSDYTDVMAQKALIDARIGLLQENRKDKVVFTGNTFVSSLIQHEDILSSLLDENYTFENNPIHDAEYVYLYQHFAKDCEDSLSTNKQEFKEQMKNIAQTLTGMVEDIGNLKQCLTDKINEKEDILDWPKISVSVMDWASVCNKCSEIREQIKRLADYVKNMICKRCEELQDKIQWLTAKHAKELDELRKSQEKDLMDIKGEWDNQRNSLTTQYEHEAATLRERARKLEHRLNAMDSEHSAHVNELRAAYQRSISTELDTDAETRKRYKEEIKQLRALCEKGLLAMENSHRRIISELEEKHRQELENLRIEKEQALSEETQATLAALDAMRKAHEHEVQKEIAKFKKEFIKQVQAREDIGVLHKEHEEEMEEIKQEILSLSAKYSSKCVESAALEEKVGALTKQIAQAQQHIMQLDARNKQLRAHLVLETNDTSLNDTIQLLRGRDSEIAEQREEIHRLQQQLKHGDILRDSTGLSRKSTTLSYLPVYPAKGILSSHEPIAKTNSAEEVLLTERPKSSPSLKMTLSSDQSKAATYSCNHDKTKSRSLTHSNSPITCENNSSDKKDNEKEEKNDEEHNGLVNSYWENLRPRSSLPHQYQGSSTASGVNDSDIWQQQQQASKQIQKRRQQQQQQQQPQQPQQQQRLETQSLRSNAHDTSRLIPEPPALSIAELMRSPTVTWSARSCHSLPSTPTPNHHSLYPPLPAVGMVAERKKRFQL